MSITELVMPIYLLQSTSSLSSQIVAGPSFRFSDFVIRTSYSGSQESLWRN